MSPLVQEDQEEVHLIAQLMPKVQELNQVNQEIQALMDLVILEVPDFIRVLLQALKAAEAEELVLQEAQLALTIQAPEVQEENIQFQVLQFIMQEEDSEEVIKMLVQDQVV